MAEAEPARSASARFQTGSDPPRTPKRLVARPRLYALLDQSTLAPLTMIVSPAGTGKTVLLAAWAHQSARDTGVLWLAAHDHAALDTHLMQSAGLSREEALDRLHKPGPGLDSAPPSLLELVSAAVEGHEPSVLVIDDAHLLAPTQVSMLAGVLRKRPDVVRLVLATRRDLALPIVELELRGDASVIRATQLRFATDEAAELIRAHASDLSPNEVQALQEESRGWAAALVLGARRLRRGREPGAAAPSIARTDQPVLDFLLGDAFTSLPKQVREVLITTFTEPVITLERAAVLSGNRNAGALLSELVNEGILVTAYVQGRTRDAVFRYHPLLVEMLRRRVVSSRVDAAVAAKGHRRAALHDAALGNRVSALQQAIAARDDELLVQLLIEFGPTLLSAGQDELLTAVIARLPGDALDRFPLLLGVAGLHRRTVGDIPGAVLLATRASETMATLRGRGTAGVRIQEDALRSDAMQLELWQSRYGWLDGATAISRARKALGCRHASAPASTHRPRIAVGPERLSLLMIELGAAEMWAGDLQNAKFHMDEAVVHSRATGHARPLAAGLSHRAVLELVSGAVRTAEATAKQALKLAGHQELSRDPYIARARMVVAWASFFRLDHDTAGEDLVRLESAISVGADAIVETYAVLLRASLLTESGRTDEARRALSTTPEAPGQLPGFLVRALALKRWHCASLAGDSATAAAQIAVLATVGSSAEVDLLTALSSPSKDQGAETIARIEGLLDELSVVDPILAASAATRRLALLLQAGDRSAARLAMVDVLSRVAPQHIVQAMTIGGTADPASLDLLSEECLRVDAHPFAAGAWRVLSRFGTERYGLGTLSGGDGATTQDRPRLLAPPTTSLRTGQPSEQVSLAGIPIRLTAREADVLEQLALGSSYTEIGRTLFITENTVKTHLASLYRKLAVDKRSAALRVARSLGLL